MAAREKITLGWRRPAGANAPQPAPQDDYVEIAEPAAPQLALVTAHQVVKVDPWTPPDPLDVCLELWKTSMRHDDKDLGYKNQNTLRGDDEGNADTSQQRCDNEIADATHACIHDLRACHRWAIYRLCGVATVWNFPHMDYLDIALEARAALEDKLRKNIATRALFD
jgi:hypothetical protein